MGGNKKFVLFTYLFMFFSLAAVEVGEHLYWNIAGLTVHGQVLLVTWLVIAIILTIAVLGTLKLEQVPKGLQNFVEAVFEYVSGIAKDQIGEHEYRPWVPFVGTLFFIHLCCKLVRSFSSLETYHLTRRRIS